MFLPIVQSSQRRIPKDHLGKYDKRLNRFIIIIPAVITEVQGNIFTASYIISDYISEVNAKAPLF